MSIIAIFVRKFTYHMFFSVFHRQGFDKMYFFFALANLLFVILIGFHELQLK